jgi:hypothetical protein
MTTRNTAYRGNSTPVPKHEAKPCVCDILARG